MALVDLALLMGTWTTIVEDLIQRYVIKVLSQHFSYHGDHRFGGSLSTIRVLLDILIILPEEVCVCVSVCLGEGGGGLLGGVCSRFQNSKVNRIPTYRFVFLPIDQQPIPSLRRESSEAVNCPAQWEFPSSAHPPYRLSLLLPQ